MKDRTLPLVIYGLFTTLLVSAVYVFGLLYSELENRARHNNTSPIIAECSPEVKEKVVYQDRVIYKDKLIYKEKIIYRDKIVYASNSEKIRYGVSLIGASLNSNLGYTFGLGFKMQYGAYYGIAEILENRSTLFSLGYEF